MGASEQTGGAIIVTNDGVTVEKQLVEDEFPIPTIRFRIVNERDDPVSVTLSETVPDDFTIGSLGFHPDYGSEYWTCLDDEKAEFDRALEGRASMETLYGIRIDDVERASAFLTEPSIESVTPVDPDEVEDPIVEADGELPDVGPAQSQEDPVEEVDEPEEPVTLSLNDEETDPVVREDQPTATSPANGDGQQAAAIDDAELPDAELPDGDIDLSGVAVPDDDSLHVEEVLGSEDPDVEVAVPTEPADAGPEDGALIERLVEELERADVDPEQKAVLRDELDVGVPSETRARIDSLQGRIETLAAYTDSLEEFLDENGTAQELLEGFETQVRALRDDVATIRHHTRANASDIGELNSNLVDLEDHVEDVADRLDAVADHAEAIEDDLAETDDHIDTVEDDLADAEDTIEDNAENIEALDQHLVEVDDELSDVEDRVSTTESDVADLETTTEDLGSDLDGVERRVTAAEAEAWAHHDRLDAAEEMLGELETTADDHAADIDDLEAETEAIRTDLDEESESIRSDLDETTSELRADLDAESESIRDDLEEETTQLRTDLDEATAELRSDLDAESEAIRDDLDDEISTVRDDISDIEDDIDDLLTWRDELGEMFQ